MMVWCDWCETEHPEEDCVEHSEGSWVCQEFAGEYRDTVREQEQYRQGVISDWMDGKRLP